MNTSHRLTPLEKMTIKINCALADYNDVIRRNINETKATQEFIITQVWDSVFRLLDICKAITTVRSIDNRTTYNVRKSLIAEGQAITSFLWLANLRDTITDVIEHYYGVDFCALRVYPLYKNNETDIEAHLAYRDTDDFRTGKRGSTLITKDGEYIFIKHDELSKWTKLSN